MRQHRNIVGTHDSAAPLHLLTVVAARKGEGCSPTGIIGRSLARQLTASGDRVRVLAESEQCHGWLSSVELSCGSVTNPDSHTEIFAGARTLFLAGAVPAAVPKVLRLAERANIRRIVLLSSHGPEYEEAYPPETWFWTAIEKSVQASSIPATVIRPSAVMGSMFEGTYPATGWRWPEMIRSESAISEPLAGNGHYPFIHEDDLASVAAAALREDTFTGTIIEAIGPPVSTRSRVASIAAATGRRVKLLNVPVDQARVFWRDQGWPEGAIDVTLYTLEEYGSRTAELTRWTYDQRPTVTEIIGRCPRTYDDWVKEHAYLFR